MEPIIKKQLITIKVDTTIERKEIEEYPTLEELKAIVGGWIEIVPYFNVCDGMPCLAFCNEDGKLNNLPLNPQATLLWRLCQKQFIHDVLVGPVAVVTGPADWVTGPQDEEDE